MKVAILMVIVTAVFEAVHGSKAFDECLLPELPKFYSTAIQVNVGKIERFNAEDGVQGPILQNFSYPY